MPNRASDSFSPSQFMKTFRLAALLPLLALLACPQQPVKSDTAQCQPEEAQAPAPKPRGGTRAVPDPQALPKLELSRPILFKLLLAEIAAQRGQTNVAVQSYLELTRDTRDPRIAQRAT